jgi:hypothetical protein
MDGVFETAWPNVQTVSRLVDEMESQRSCRWARGAVSAG